MEDQKIPDAAGAEPVKVNDEKSESSTETVPWHKDPRWQQFQSEKKTLQAAQEKLDSILKANDLEDPDDLAELVQSGKAVKGKVTDPALLDAIIAKAQKLDQYEAYWTEQKEKERRRNEDPEERADRAERQLVEEKKRRQFEENVKRQALEAKKSLETYESEVTRLIHEIEIPKDQQPFALEFMGVGNPANDIDINDKKAVKRIVNEFKKKKEAYDQAIIQNYLKSKQEVPKVTSSTSAASTTDAPKINLKDARKIAHERIRALFQGG